MQREETVSIRLATLDDREALREMQAFSMCVLGAGFYSPEEIGGFISHVGTMDDFLLHEGTYYLIERKGQVIASGGWSRLRPNYANAAGKSGQGTLKSGQPKVRSVFVHPAFARRGLASRLMDRAESEARAAGFTTIELSATLSGVPLYEQRGYERTGPIVVPLPGGHRFGGVTMRKPLSADGTERETLSAAG